LYHQINVCQINFTKFLNCGGKLFLSTNNVQNKTRTKQYKELETKSGNSGEWTRTTDNTGMSHG